MGLSPGLALGYFCAPLPTQTALIPAMTAFGLLPCLWAGSPPHHRRTQSLPERETTLRCHVQPQAKTVALTEGCFDHRCCGASGRLVQREKGIEAHAGRVGPLAAPECRQTGAVIFDPTSNPITWRQAILDPANRGIDTLIAPGDSFHHQRHLDLKAGFILANPPCNLSERIDKLQRDGTRWQCAPPAGSAPIGH